MMPTDTSAGHCDRANKPPITGPVVVIPNVNPASMGDLEPIAKPTIALRIAPFDTI